MNNYIIVSMASGILLAILDGLINANPVAIKLLSVYKAIAKPSVNIVAGTIIDLGYGFILAALFLILYPGFPGETGLAKGAGFALIVWFLRVVMNTASQWMMFNVPMRVLLYTTLAGLIQMLAIGIFYGLTLNTGN